MNTSQLRNDNVHELHKKIIHKYLDLFVEYNNIEAKDFVVIGSSCGIYMDYLQLKTMRDIDVYLLNNELIDNCTITERTDLIRNILLPKDFTERIVEKDGYFFLCEKDFMINTCAAGLLKLKGKDFIYTKTMLSKLNMTCNELCDILEENIPKMERCIKYPKDLIKISLRLNLIKKYCH